LESGHSVNNKGASSGAARRRRRRRRVCVKRMRRSVCACNAVTRTRAPRLGVSVRANGALELDIYHRGGGARAYVRTDVHAYVVRVSTQKRAPVTGFIRGGLKRAECWFAVGGGASSPDGQEPGLRVMAWAAKVALAAASAAPEETWALGSRVSMLHGGSRAEGEARACRDRTSATQRHSRAAGVGARRARRRGGAEDGGRRRRVGSHPLLRRGPRASPAARRLREPGAKGRCSTVGPRRTAHAARTRSRWRIWTLHAPPRGWRTRRAPPRPPLLASARA